ncbi:MAG TPA: hypothetical protein PKW18_06820 [Candidatus Sumerlaeota bacterium]|nr:MAG: hypothetical protein BWY12_02521 [candidate division BRC1 bacterium ADurb.Bin183]HOE63004.1 hypothetical protein [Candidatus Sumerlaeota bacterium]HRR30169.1 hypothetical protein [Candidatus Sumerlaeia bacterium]HON49567.1 hypothetical protein [Candidatus Sumerlaeota bacterium]HOR64719.1 hypothetical protein [Candidatus Sumerlaeota bacterium]
MLNFRIKYTTLLFLLEFLSFAFLVFGCGSVNGGRLPGFDVSPHFEEQYTSATIQDDVKILINAPSAKQFDPSKPTRLILYALPNGNTLSQTFGKKLKPGVDWHYGIQHIGAQTRRMREVIEEENIIVAYLEAGGRSWPAWRKKYPDSGKRIEETVEFVRRQIPGVDVSLELSSHSGGGSFIFGYINNHDQIPDDIMRISFLDANYGYSDEDKHGDKLVEWLGRNPKHFLNILCYDDRNIKINGKPIVGPTGGTWRKTLLMIERIQKDIPLEKTQEQNLVRYRDKNRQVDIIMHTNPENKILHTVLVGDYNGFIHTSTAGAKYEGKAAVFAGPAAYEKWIHSD